MQLVPSSSSPHRSQVLAQYDPVATWDVELLINKECPPSQLAQTLRVPPATLTGRLIAVQTELFCFTHSIIPGTFQDLLMRIFITYKMQAEVLFEIEIPLKISEQVKFSTSLETFTSCTSQVCSLLFAFQLGSFMPCVLLQLFTLPTKNQGNSQPQTKKEKGKTLELVVWSPLCFHECSHLSPGNGQRVSWVGTCSPRDCHWRTTAPSGWFLAICFLVCCGLFKSLFVF